MDLQLLPDPKKPPPRHLTGTVVLEAVGAAVLFVAAGFAGADRSWVAAAAFALVGVWTLLTIPRWLARKGNSAAPTQD